MADDKRKAAKNDEPLRFRCRSCGGRLRLSSRGYWSECRRRCNGVANHDPRRHGFWIRLRTFVGF